MKKLTTIICIAFTLLVFSNAIAQGDAELASKEIIKAYKTQDLKLLKKYITGIMIYTIDDKYFESKDGKPLVDIAKSWNGDIKEIRYAMGDIMGKKVLLASAYFSDNPNGNLNVVILSSYEKSDWKAFLYGISEATQDEFNEGSLEIPTEKSVKEQAKIDYSDFSIEMASGDTYDKVSTDKLAELLKSLNDDNFFLILNSKTGFMQASTSEKGYIIQYSNGDEMFEAESYFNLEETCDIFKLYLDGGNWKEKAKWTEM